MQLKIKQNSTHSLPVIIYEVGHRVEGSVSCSIRFITVQVNDVFIPLQEIERRMKLEYCGTNKKLYKV